MSCYTHGCLDGMWWEGMDRWLDVVGVAKVKFLFAWMGGWMAGWMGGCEGQQVFLYTLPYARKKELIDRGQSMDGRMDAEGFLFVFLSLSPTPPHFSPLSFHIPTSVFLFGSVLVALRVWVRHTSTQAYTHIQTTNEVFYLLLLLLGIEGRLSRLLNKLILIFMEGGGGWEKMLEWRLSEEWVLEWSGGMEWSGSGDYNLLR